jgi:hypothetical protein
MEYMKNNDSTTKSIKGYLENLKTKITSIDPGAQISKAMNASSKFEQVCANFDDLKKQHNNVLEFEKTVLEKIKSANKTISVFNALIPAKTSESSSNQTSNLWKILFHVFAALIFGGVEYLLFLILKQWKNNKKYRDERETTLENCRAELSSLKDKGLSETPLPRSSDSDKPSPLPPGDISSILLADKVETPPATGEQGPKTTPPCQSPEQSGLSDSESATTDPSDKKSGDTERILNKLEDFSKLFNFGENSLSEIVKKLSTLITKLNELLGEGKEGTGRTAVLSGTALQEIMEKDFKDFLEKMKIGIDHSTQIATQTAKIKQLEQEQAQLTVFAKWGEIFLKVLKDMPDTLIEFLRKSAFFPPSNASNVVDPHTAKEVFGSLIALQAQVESQSNPLDWLPLLRKLAFLLPKFPQEEQNNWKDAISNLCGGKYLFRIPTRGGSFNPHEFEAQNNVTMVNEVISWAVLVVSPTTGETKVEPTAKGRVR